MKKRYSIVNFYTQGSSVLPQVSHGLNNLWKQATTNGVSPIIKEMLFDWAHGSEIEVVLEGFSDSIMRELSNLAKSIQMPSADFKEPDMCDVTTVVTFIPTDLMVEMMDRRNTKYREALSDVYVDVDDWYTYTTKIASIAEELGVPYNELLVSHMTMTRGLKR